MLLESTKSVVVADDYPTCVVRDVSVCDAFIPTLRGRGARTRDPRTSTTMKEAQTYQAQAELYRLETNERSQEDEALSVSMSMKVMVLLGV